MNVVEFLRTKRKQQQREQEALRVHDDSVITNNNQYLRPGLCEEETDDLDILFSVVYSHHTKCNKRRVGQQLHTTSRQKSSRIKHNNK